MSNDEHLVDARGLNCPMPLLQTRLALNNLPSGAQVRILASDAGAERDIPAFAQLVGHHLLSSSKLADGSYEFVLVKS